MNVLKLVFFNTVFYMMFFWYLILGVPFLTLLVTFFSFFSSRRRVIKLCRHVACWWGFAIVRVLIFPFVRVQYKDFADDDEKGPFIFVCNHRSFSDGFLVAIPALYYEIIQVVNIWPFRMPLLGVIARIIGYLSINEMSFEKFSDQACKALEQKTSIIAFPEGTRSGSRIMRQFHSAVFRIALQAKCAIVPVCISGNENIPPRDSFLMHPGIIKMHKLPALQWKEYRNLNPFKLKNKVRDIISGELAVMEGRQ